MNFNVFFVLLSAFATLSSLLTDAVKNFISDKENFSYNMIALINALIVGCTGMVLYYRLAAIPFTAGHLLSMILMGLSSGLVSMVGFDKFKQTIEQIIKQKG